jgi:hypothetical protein
MANDSFVGRESLLAELRDHFRGSENKPFVIYDLGGMGKSAALARHVVWALDEAAAVVVPLDFDDATLNPYYPADIVARIVEIVARQVEFDPQDLLAEPDDLDLDLPEPRTSSHSTPPDGRRVSRGRAASTPWSGCASSTHSSASSNARS